MDSNDFYKFLKTSFPFTPTLKQNIGLQKLSNFIFSTLTSDVFVLKGYAGTGKTTIISVLVKNLWRAKKSAVLLAPTGRAAKVISNYSKNEAFTIHKKIYTPRADKNGKMSFILAPNKHKKTLFIAPSIHEDSKNMTEWLFEQKDIKIINYDIEEFIQKIETTRVLN